MFYPNLYTWFMRLRKVWPIFLLFVFTSLLSGVVGWWLGKALLAQIGPTSHLIGATMESWYSPIVKWSSPSLFRWTVRGCFRGTEEHRRTSLHCRTVVHRRHVPKGTKTTTTVRSQEAFVGAKKKRASAWERDSLGSSRVVILNQTRQVASFFCWTDGQKWYKRDNWQGMAFYERDISSSIPFTFKIHIDPSLDPWPSKRVMNSSLGPFVNNAGSEKPSWEFYALALVLFLRNVWGWIWGDELFYLPGKDAHIRFQSPWFIYS